MIGRGMLTTQPLVGPFCRSVVAQPTDQPWHTEPLPSLGDDGSTSSNRGTPSQNPRTHVSGELLIFIRRGNEFRVYQNSAVIYI